MRFAFFVEADPTVRGESVDALVVSIRGNRHFEEITGSSELSVGDRVLVGGCG